MFQINLEPAFWGNRILREILLQGVLFATKMLTSYDFYIYAFSRCFYPKRLTVHSGNTFFFSMCSLGIEATTFCAANAMLYHWATGIFCCSFRKFHILLLMHISYCITGVNYSMLYIININDKLHANYFAYYIHVCKYIITYFLVFLCFSMYFIFFFFFFTRTRQYWQGKKTTVIHLLI